MTDAVLASPSSMDDLAVKSARRYRPDRTHAGKYVAYYRVSTQRQGDHGYGLDAQRADIERFLNGGNWKLDKEFTEIESGRRNDRPELLKALKHCKVIGATLLIAKIDRLTRNLHFITGLMESGVDFVACDFPNANRLTVHLLAAFAEHEARMISERTRKGLATAKARGVRMGNPRGADALRRAGKGNAAAMKRLKEKAQERAEMLRDVIDDIRAAGITSMSGIARELNARGIRTERPTYKGEPTEWHAATVRNLLRRLETKGGTR